MPKQIPPAAKAFLDQYSPKDHPFYEALKASGVKFIVIAEALGVSPSKLSKLLHGFESPSPDLENRLEALVRELHAPDPVRSEENLHEVSDDAEEGAHGQIDS